MNGQDSLTGLYDWQAAKEKIMDLLGRREIKSGLLFYMDMDDFREVNEIYGYAAGNEMLKSVGDFLLAISREESVAARIGGDEFLLFLGNVPGGKEAYSQAMQLYASCVGAAGEGTASMSMGIACYPEDATAYEELAARADEALYASKHTGKQCFLFYEDLSRL